MTHRDSYRSPLHMVGIAHLDPVWLWNWQEGYASVRATFLSALDRMDEDPDFTFTADSVCYYAWIEENDPEAFERIRRRVAEGRWELAGGWWIEPDCNLPSGESFVRQGLYGQRYLLDQFGRTASVGMNVDPFGHTAMLPQILRGQRMGGYVFHRPEPEELELPGPLFWWESADGSRVIAYRIPYEYCSQIGEIEGHIAGMLADVPSVGHELMCFYGCGNHGGGPTRETIAGIRRLDARPAHPHLEFGTPERYFDALAGQGVIDGLGVVRRELQHTAVGCYSTLPWLKAMNRTTEQVLQSAEAWAAIAGRLCGLDYPREELAGAWKQLLFNQFHDILTGTSLPSTYEDVRDQVGEARSVGSRVLNRSIQSIARLIDIPFEDGTWPVLVFNSLPWPVRSTVELELETAPGDTWLTNETGAVEPSQLVRTESVVRLKERIVWTAELPALGHRLYRVRAGATRPDRGGAATSPALRATGTVLENALLRAVVDPGTGWLSELVDRRTGASLLPDAMRPHAVVIDDPSDTWGHGVSAFEGVLGTFAVDSVSLVESGPVRAVIRVTSSFGSSRLVEELLLAADSPLLEVRATLDWSERQRLLKLRVPTALTAVTATYEVPYGHVVREPTGIEEPGQTWVDVTGALPDGRRAGVSVLNDCTYGFDVRNGDVGLTVTRSPVFAWHDPTPLDPGETYEYQGQGRLRLRYALLPHAGDWRQAETVRRAAEFNRRPITLLESFHAGRLPGEVSHACVSGGSVIVTVIKGAEDPGGDLVVRAVESAGSSTDATIELPVAGRRIVASFRPHEIRTFRIPADDREPVAETDLLEIPSARVEDRADARLTWRSAPR